MLLSNLGASLEAIYLGTEGVKMVCKCVCRQREREYIPITIRTIVTYAAQLDLGINAFQLKPIH